MSIFVTSVRKIRKEAYYDVVFEWEDSMAEYFQTQVKLIPSAVYHACKTYCKLNQNYKLHQNFYKDCSIYFAMSPSEMSQRVFLNGIPIFMDVWTDEHVEYIVQKTRDLQLFYCTSLEVYRKIKEKDYHSVVKYMPLSVSDLYFSENFSRYKRKSIDVIQVGRRNQVLHEYMMRYVEKYPQIDYVYTNGIAHNELIEYVSTKRGNIGTIVDRENYIKVLSSAKVSLVSTPAIDGSNRLANGIDFLTPRFYESAILGCAMVGRYGVNEETAKISAIIPNITTYDQFIMEMDRALSMGSEELYHREESFIKENLTTCRATQIENDIKALQQNSKK